MPVHQKGQNATKAFGQNATGSRRSIPAGPCVPLARTDLRPEPHHLVSSFFSPSGKMILKTKKKMTIETPPVMKVTRMLYTASGT